MQGLNQDGQARFNHHACLSNGLGIDIGLKMAKYYYNFQLIRENFWLMHL
jgi:hypothetical protein